MERAAQPQIPPTAMAEPATLLVSFELSESCWVLTLRQPSSGKLSRVSLPARDMEKLLGLLTAQRQQAERWSQRAVRVISIYEAGRDGFWLHRWLLAQGIESHVVDPASILGPQRRRKAKTDRIDGERLLRSLAGWLGGEGDRCSMVRPPSVAQEDERRLSRERGELVKERTRLSNRINGLLANQGIAGFKPLQTGAQQALDALRTGDGHALLSAAAPVDRAHPAAAGVAGPAAQGGGGGARRPAEGDAGGRSSQPGRGIGGAGEATVADAIALDRPGVRHRAVGGMFLPAVRQPPPGGIVRRSGTNTVVERQCGA